MGKKTPIEEENEERKSPSKRKWSNEEEKHFLQYLKQNRDIEMPSAAVYYTKMKKKIDLLADCTVEQLKCKTKNFKRLYLNTSSWRKTKTKDNDEETIRDKTLKKCKHYYELVEIFGANCSTPVLRIERLRQKAEVNPEDSGQDDNSNEDMACGQDEAVGNGNQDKNSGKSGSVDNGDEDDDIHVSDDEDYSVDDDEESNDDDDEESNDDDADFRPQRRLHAYATRSSRKNKSPYESRRDKENSRLKPKPFGSDVEALLEKRKLDLEMQKFQWEKKKWEAEMEFANKQLELTRQMLESQKELVKYERELKQQTKLKIAELHKAANIDQPENDLSNV